MNGDNMSLEIRKATRSARSVARVQPSMGATTFKGRTFQVCHLAGG
jgi:hypothetical protein